MTPLIGSVWKNKASGLNHLVLNIPLKFSPEPGIICTWSDPEEKIEAVGGESFYGPIDQFENEFTWVSNPKKKGEE